MWEATANSESAQIGIAAAKAKALGVSFIKMYALL